MGAASLSWCADPMKVVSNVIQRVAPEETLVGLEHVVELNSKIKIGPSPHSRHLKMFRDAVLVEPTRIEKAIRTGVAPEVKSLPLSKSLNLECHPIFCEGLPDRNEPVSREMEP